MIGIVNNFHPHTGLGKFSFNLLKQIRGLEDAEMLYLESPDNKLHDAPDGVQKIVQKKSFPFFNKTLSWYYHFPPRIPKGYAVYHATSQYLARIAAFRSPCIISHFDLAPLVFAREFPFHQKFFLKKAIAGYRHADLITIASEKRREEVLAIPGVREENVSFVQLGIDHDVFFPIEKKRAREQLGLPPDTQIVLQVGSEEPRKNVPVLLRAFQSLQESNQDVLLVKVGSSDARNAGAKKGLSISQFSGVPEEQLRMFYSAADVFVFPTRYEGFGYPPLEAMACGCPVVTSKEMDAYSGSCRILKENSAEELARELELLLKNESLRKRYAEKGITCARQYTLEREAHSFLQNYYAVMH